MAFYGNITNTSQTTFQFDRIYSNRLEMEVNCPNDGIFVGRYVLVEYDDEAAFPVVYKINNKFYTTSKEDANTQIKYGGTIRPASETIYSSLDKIYLNEIVQTQLVDETIQFYKCTGGDNGIAIFEHLNKDVTSTNNYIRNFSIDEQHYNPTEEKSDKWKGFDSTVWVKTTVTIDGKLYTKYVWIADLNSVVPTFDVAADAPTMEPLIPHFDADSTNVYYKLHLQSPYGFRIKENTDRSDETTTHYTTTYDSVTGKTTTTPVPNIKADIFYNKAAFKYKPNDTSNRVITAPTDDTIKIEPTGRSKDFNSKYSHTTNTGDIQEMTINLPTVGYMISKGWDVIHGENRDDARTDAHDSLQGRLDSFKDMLGNQIPVKRAPDGTFVGTNINGGKNRTVSNIEGEPLLIDDKTQDDAWIKTNINTTGLTNAKNKNNNGISIHHTFTSGTNTTTSANKNDESSGDGINKGKNDVLKLYTPIVDAAGHVVAQNTETVILPYSYKTIKTNTGLTDTATRDIYTTIEPGTAIVAESDTKTGAVSSTVANNTQDILSVTPQNKWIQVQLSNDELKLAHEVHAINTIAQATNKNTDNVDSDLNSDKITVQDLDFDRAGHVIKNQPHTYTLPYGFKTITTNGREDGEDSNTNINATTTPVKSNVIADNTQDTLAINSGNKWIRIDTNANTDSLTISHDIHVIDTNAVEEKTDKNADKKAPDEITIQDLTFDVAGHVIGNKEHTYILPYGFKTIKVENSTEVTIPASTVSTNGQSADNTQDTLTLSASNKWIKLDDTNNDTVKIGHAISDLNAGTYTSNDTTIAKFGDSFNILNFTTDEAGHVTGCGQTTITIPVGAFTTPSDYTTTSDIMCSLTYEPESGKISYNKTNTNTLNLSNYEADTGTLKITQNGSINSAFKTIANYINNLDLLENQSTTQFISSIKQEDGKVTVARANAGTLTLGAATTNNIISATNSLNEAFDILDKRIINDENNHDILKGRVDILTADSTKEGSVAYQIAKIVNDNNNGSIDTLNEIAAWIVNDKTGAASIAKKADSAVQKTTTFTYGTETKTIQDLMTIVNKQAATITALSGKINELEQRIAVLEPTTGE